MRQSKKLLMLVASVAIVGFAGESTSAGWFDFLHKDDECRQCECKCESCQKEEKRHCCCFCFLPPEPPRAPVGVAIPADLQGGFVDQDAADLQGQTADMQQRVDGLAEDLTRLTLIVEQLLHRTDDEFKLPESGDEPADPQGVAPTPPPDEKAAATGRLNRVTRRPAPPAELQILQ